MIIDEKLKNNMKDLRLLIEYAEDRNSLTDLQLEKFLRAFEQVRYNLLNDIKIYNKSVDYEYEKIKTIDDDYKAEIENNILKIYVPEVMPSFKNIKTQERKSRNENKKIGTVGYPSMEQASQTWASQIFSLFYFLPRVWKMSFRFM